MLETPNINGYEVDFERDHPRRPRTQSQDEGHPHDQKRKEWEDKRKRRPQKKPANFEANGPKKVNPSPDKGEICTRNNLCYAAIIILLIIGCIILFAMKEAKTSKQGL